MDAYCVKCKCTQVMISSDVSGKFARGNCSLCNTQMSKYIIPKHDWPFKLGCLISHLWLSLMETELIGLVGVLIIGMSVILKVGTHASGR